jgi:hypothetical protein
VLGRGSAGKVEKLAGNGQERGWKTISSEVCLGFNLEEIRMLNEEGNWSEAVGA